MLAGHKFMCKLRLREQGFTYCICRLFTKHCERTQKLRETGNLNKIYEDKLDKACFANDAASSDSKVLFKRTI